jgi:predicted nucleic acid-binding protein
MPFVLDTSVIMAWCFEDERTDYGHRVLELLSRDHVLVPAVLPLEVANALRSAERRGRLQESDAVRFGELLRGLPITVDDSGIELALGPILSLAREHGLTSYDASYLELALREGLALATYDGPLADAARRAGVTLIE